MQSSNTPKYLIGSLIVVGVLFLIANLILSNMLAIADNVVEPEPMDAESIAERIKPVAKENIGEEQIAEAPAPAAEENGAEADAGGDDSVGKKVVTQVCAVCHSTGMMNSPKLASADDWAPRIEKGMDTLYNHAINGFNMMPARGGNPKLTDDEVKAAVDYMVSSAK
ncbi:c-type cytochrome [Methylophaga pinxianii]|uniref:c-type cytochrome n=1 Tax=Methylophaga pinxianii TaxID=2881052 RepID=UPI001CF39BB0|nr:c-type cytochrome [Methylophaga pinxianii]MCB2427036.1 c-type cytochrome [Methylophaga pinxianii]UPH46919.1 c-type cytochrome [Methylophaga pinxianii]